MFDTYKGRTLVQMKIHANEQSPEIARLREALKPFADAYATVQRETERLAVVNPKVDWQFASRGYRKVLGENIAPTWFRDAFQLLNQR